MVKMIARVMFVVAFLLTSAHVLGDPLLVYTTNEGVIGSANEFHLYTLDVGANGAPVEITPPDSQAYAAVWSPDGRRLLFTLIKDGVDQEEDTGVYTMNPDGKNLKVIVDTPNVVEDQAQWSPDGQRIAYFVGSPFKRRSVWVFNLNSGAKQEVVPAEGELLIKFTTLAWSPDGQQIAFDAFGPANLRGVYVVRVGSKQVDLLHRDLWATLVQYWLPSGELLVTSGVTQKLSILRPGEETEVLFPEVQEQFSYTGEARATWRWPDLLVFSAGVRGCFSIKRDGTGLRQLMERGEIAPDLWVDTLDVPTPADHLTTTWGAVKTDKMR